MRNDLANRGAVVTGGASGIGRAAALALARHGARVTVGDFSPLAENDALFRELGIQQRTCDVRREADVKDLVDAAAARAGGLHVLVCSAGVGMVKQITEVTEEDWDDCLDT